MCCALIRNLGRPKEAHEKLAPPQTLERIGEDGFGECILDDIQNGEGETEGGSDEGQAANDAAVGSAVGAYNLSEAQVDARRSSRAIV
jgi:hypothetical protein